MSSRLPNRWRPGRRATVGLFVLVALSGFVAISSSWSGIGEFSAPAGAITSDRSGSREASPVTVGADAIPSFAVLATTDAPLTDENRLEVVDAITEIEGIRRATAEPRPNPAAAEAEQTTVFYLVTESSFDQGVVARVGQQVDQVITDTLPGAAVVVGGPAVVNDMLVGRHQATATALTIFAMVVGAGLGVVFGWQRGLAAAGTLGLSVLAGGILARQIAGPFDGSIAAGAVPGALAGLVVGVAIAIRLLLWFRDPEGADGAEMIRRSVLRLVPEIGAVLVGLLVASVVVGLMDSGPSPLSAMLFGGFVAAAIQAGVMAPALALLTNAREAKSALFPVSIPDGRDLPLLVLSGAGALLLVLSLFGFARPGLALSGIAQLDQGEPAAEVAELLRTTGGDATNAVVAVPSEAASQVDLVEWGRAAAELPSVEWVEVGSSRLTSVDETELPAIARVLDPAVDGGALVALTVPSRSEAARSAVADLNALPMIGGPPALSGPAVDAIGASGARSTVLVAVLVMALAGAVGVRVLTQSTSQSVVSFLLRLLGGMALLGVFSLLGSQVQTAVLVTGLGAVGLAVGLFELEFLGQFHDRTDGRETTWTNPGQAGAMALVALAIGGLVMAVVSPIGGGPGTGLLGMVLAIGVIIELFVGALLLRPALLGQRAAFHTAVRPVRVAMHSGIERQDEYQGVEDPGWRRVIGDLLQAEFRFQSQPAEAVLSAVFVPDTPLYRQAAAHHANLAGAGLRIVGRSPRLRSIKTVTGRTPVTLAVTVDHPVRHLVDGQGTVVGVRNAERRSGVLWLSRSDDGSYRIAESVELGSVALPEPDLVEEFDLTGVEAVIGAETGATPGGPEPKGETDHANPIDRQPDDDLAADGEHGHSDPHRLRS